MKNGKYKTFRTKSAYEAWRRGMFGRMEHGGKVRFVSREAQAKAKIQYRKKGYKKEKDVTDRSNVVSGRVKSHGSLVKVEKKKGEDRAQGYRTQVTATDKFEVSETEEAGKYTPLNTQLDIQEDGDNIVITRTSKSDGRIISSTVLRAASSEGINTFFFDLEERFSDNEDLKLWELRALADHFNVKSGGLTAPTLEKRLRKHMEGELPDKFYTNPRHPTEGLPEEGMSAEERADQEEFNIPPVDSTPISETPFSFEREQIQKASLLTPQARRDLSPLQQAAEEEAIIELVTRDEGTAVGAGEGDKTLNDPSENEFKDGLFGAALGSDEPLVPPKQPRSKSNLSKSMSYTKYPDEPNDRRKPIKEIFSSGQNRQKLIDQDGNTFSFYKDEHGEVKLTDIKSLGNEDLDKKFDKQQIYEKFNVSGNFDIDYTIDER
jgi:hypothetical protein